MSMPLSWAIVYVACSVLIGSSSFRRLTSWLNLCGEKFRFSRSAARSFRFVATSYSSGAERPRFAEARFFFARSTATLA